MPQTNWPFGPSHEFKRRRISRTKLRLCIPLFSRTIPHGTEPPHMGWRPVPTSCVIVMILVIYYISFCIFKTDIRNSSTQQIRKLSTLWVCSLGTLKISNLSTLEIRSVSTLEIRILCTRTISISILKIRNLRSALVPIGFMELSHWGGPVLPSGQPQWGSRVGCPSGETQGVA